VETYVELSGQGGTDGRYQLSLHLAFQDIAERTFSPTGAHKLFFRMNRQKDYSSGRTHFSQFLDSINPAQYWHRDISNNDIRLQAESFGHQGSAVTRGSNHVKVGRQQGRRGLQQMPVIIGQQYARAIQDCNSWGKHASVKMADTAKTANLTVDFAV
jgi:hypothetical protein